MSKPIPTFVIKKKEEKVVWKLRTPEMRQVREDEVVEKELGSFNLDAGTPSERSVDFVPDRAFLLSKSLD